MSFIQVQCGGRLVRDPEVNYSNSGMAVCKFSLAIDKPKRQGQAKAEADFFNFVAFGKLAETIGNNYSKGNYILVRDCRPQNDSYVAKDGTKKSNFSFVVNAIEFTDGKRGGGNQNQHSSMADFGNEVDF